MDALEAESLRQARAAFEAHPHDIACFIAEPIQGEGGDRHFRPQFFAAMRALCDEFDALLIFDEVQTGCGLTGTAWAYQQLGVAPDVVAFGKKTQVCGVMAGRRVDEVADNVFAVSSRINSTWGGNLVDMVRSRRILEVIEADGLFDNAAEQGRYLHARLDELAADFPELVLDVRGRGLMCAFSLPSGEQRDELIRRLWDRRVVMLASGADSVRFRPALTVSSARSTTPSPPCATRLPRAPSAADGAVSRRIVDRSRASSWPPTSSQPCNSASLRAAGVNSWFVTTMVLVQPCIGAPATTSCTAPAPTGTGLPFALHGKAIGPISDDQVDAPVTGDRCHDHRHPAGPCDPRDMVFELHPRHRLGRGRLSVTWGECADDGGQQETRRDGKQDRCDDPDRSAPGRARAKQVRRRGRGDADGYIHLRPGPTHEAMVGAQADMDACG